MKYLSLFGILLLGTVSTASFAQSIQSVDHSNGHAAHVEQQIEKLARFQAGVRAIVLRRQISQSWDNEAWVDDTRTTYDYTGELQTSSLTETWNGEAWENSTRWMTVYSGGRISETRFEAWDGTSWNPENRSLYTYSSASISEVIEQGYVNGAWVDEMRTTITMSGGNLASTLTEVWEGGAWVPQDRYSITQEGSDVVAVSAQWDGSSWVNADRTVYADLTVEELFDLFEDFQMEGDTWLGFSLLLRFPDSVVQEWDGTQWVNVSRQVTERDAADRPIAVTMETWDESAWTAESRYVASYDGQGRISVVEWQMFAGDWMPFFIETHAYDNAGLLESLTTQYDFGTGLVNGSRLVFEWANTSTAVEAGEMPSRIRLAAPYPNPFNPRSIIQYYLDSPEHASLRVFDAAGRLVSTLVDGVQAAGDHTAVFDAAGLPSGLYMIRLETPSHAETRAVTLLR